MSISEAVEVFLNACAARGRSPATLEWYRFMIGAFIAWLQKSEINGSKWCTPSMIEAFLADERTRLQPSSVAGRYRALRAFFSFLVERKLLAVSPMLDMKPPRVPKRAPRRASLEEYDRLLSSIPRGSWIDVRDRLTITILFLTGLRVSELARLAIGDIDLGAKLLTVREGKGGDHRYVPVLPVVAMEFGAYMLLRPGSAERRLLLASDGGLGVDGVLGPNGVRSMLRRRCAAAGVAYLNPHSFRHGIATRMLSGGGDASLVQKILGHKDINTTLKIYAEWLTDDVIEQFNRLLA